MPFLLKMRRMDIGTGDDARVVVLRGHDAAAFGINPGDRLEVHAHGKKLNVVADITHHSIRHGEIGLFEEVWKLLRGRDGHALEIQVVSRPTSIAAIKKKLLGHTVTRREMHSIIEDIVNRKLTPIETTYFVSSGYVKPYRIEELIWMVDSMAKTGDMFHWPSRRVVDKHSVGGLAGNRTTMVAIPIIASLGLTIPKTSSRAITSPAGTADTMEVLAPVTFRGDEVRQIVARTGGCLIWGGGLSIAPADDIIIRLSRPLSLEPYDKMIVSIMAKKVAMGIKYLIIDMPYGPDTKIPNVIVARQLEQRFQQIGKAFNIKLQVRFDQARQPVGQGIGPALEARDVLRVLQQQPKRPRDLEQKAIALTTELLVLSGVAKAAAAKRLAVGALQTGAAWKKMQHIISAQGGDPHIQPDQLVSAAVTKNIYAKRDGIIQQIDNRAIDEVARTLGAPEHKLAGIYLHRKIGQRINQGDPLFTLYSYNHERLDLAQQALRRNTMVTFGSGRS